MSLFFVLFLANGYKYDFVSNQIRRTGIIDVTFQDKLAQVYLDGKKLEGNLPFLASNVLPGKYNLVVAREGFWEWSKEIMVTENIISKVEDVLLYPLDEHSISKVLLVTTDLKSDYLLRGEYFFKIQGENLNYGRLSKALTQADLKKLILPASDLQEIDVQLNKAFLTFNSGKHYMLDLITGDLIESSNSKSLVYGLDKWIYYKKNLLAIFDINLKEVLFAKEFVNEEIVAVKYFDMGGKAFLLLSMKGQTSGTLYQYVNQSLMEVSRNVTSAPFFDEHDNIVFLNEFGELWKYTKLNDRKLLLARFSSKIDLLGFALNKEKTAGQLIWKEAGTWNVGDLGFSNVRAMFKKNQLIDLKLSDAGQIYYLEKIQTDAPENAIQIRLMEMDLDI